MVGLVAAVQKQRHCNHNAWQSRPRDCFDRTIQNLKVPRVQGSEWMTIPVIFGAQGSGFGQQQGLGSSFCDCTRRSQKLPRLLHAKVPRYSPMPPWLELSFQAFRGSDVKSVRGVSGLRLTFRVWKVASQIHEESPGCWPPCSRSPFAIFCRL